MPFEVTATRKRPQLFDELAGQEFIVSTLASSIKAGRIAHAYLFAGPRGVGKTSAARILARALNCENGPTAAPCGVCSACVEIARGNSLDVIEIDGASNTSVNDVREIKDEVLFSPNSSRYKVYIIDEVHMLSNSAFNALLKTIEEPPPYIVFIFATTEIHKVPATIRSRCQQFNFRLIPIDVMKGLLIRVCDELKIRAEPEALLWIAKEATGSLRDAYTLFDQIVSFAGDEITLAQIREKLGLAGIDQVGALAEACAAGDSRALLLLADETLSRGVSIEQLVIDLAEYFRNLLFIRHGVEREGLLGVSPERYSETARRAFSVTQLEQAIDLLLELYRNIRFSLNQRFELELTLSRLAGLGSYLTPTEIMQKVRELRAEIAGDADRGPSEGRQAATTSSTARPPVHPAARTERKSQPPASRADSAPSSPQRETPQASTAVLREAPPASLAAGSGSPAVRIGAPASAMTAPTAGPDEDQEAEEEPDYDALGPEEEIDRLPPEDGTAVLREAATAAARDEVRGNVVALLRKTKVALSAAIEKAVGWELEGDELMITCDNQFSANLVRDDLPAVGEILQRVTGRKVNIKVESSKNRPVKDVQGRENEQIELVKRVFRGEVIQGGDA